MPAFHSAAISTKMLQELGGSTVIGPLLVGLMRAWTGSFRASALLFVAIGAVLAMAGAGAGRARVVGAAAVPR